MAVIYAFGDSITYGAWDIEGGGWANRLRCYFDGLQDEDPSLYYIVYNLGIPGETTDGLVNRFELEIKARERKDSIFVFAYGANDVALAGDKYTVAKDAFKANLSEAVAKAKNVSQKIVLVNITPVIEEVTNNTGNPLHRKRLNKDIQDYNKVIAGIGAEQNCQVADVNSLYIKSGCKELFDEDGLHPNAKGHEIIFEEVKKSL